MTLFANDLSAIHKHQGALDGVTLTDQNGSEIDDGYITTETLREDDLDNPGATYENTYKVLRSSTRQASGSTVSDGTTTWRITSVEGDEGAWMHTLEVTR